MRMAPPCAATKMPATCGCAAPRDRRRPSRAMELATRTIIGSDTRVPGGPLEVAQPAFLVGQFQAVHAPAPVTRPRLSRARACHAPAPVAKLHGGVAQRLEPTHFRFPFDWARNGGWHGASCRSAMNAKRFKVLEPRSAQALQDVRDTPWLCGSYACGMTGCQKTTAHVRPSSGRRDVPQRPRHPRR